MSTTEVEVKVIVETFNKEESLMGLIAELCLSMLQLS